MKTVRTLGSRGVQLVAIVLLFYICTLPILGVIFYGVSAEGDPLKAKDYLRLLELFRNSVGLSLAVTVLSVLLAILATFTLFRLRFRGQRALRVLMLTPLVNPTFVGTLSFIMLFGKRGLITYRLLHLSVSPYGWQGVLILQVLSLTTIAYLVLSGAVRSTDVALEDAARNLGTPEGRIFLRITLPMMLPEITAAALLVFLASMADFTTPLVIGGSFRTLASDLYVQITGVYDMRMASITGIFLLAPCFLAFCLQQRLSRRRKYSTDQSTGQSIEYAFVAPWVKRLLIAGTTLLISFFLLIIIFIVVGAFTVNWGYDYSFTTANLQEVLLKDARVFLVPLRNSVMLAVVTGLVSSLIGVTVAYQVFRRKILFPALVDGICLFPAAVPGILFGIGYLVTFKYPLFGVGSVIFPEAQGIVLLGTGVIIYIICVARDINVSMKSCYALLEHMEPDLEAAAYNLGASRGQTMRYVILPVLKDAFVNAYLRVFSGTMTTLGAIVFLLLPSNKVIIQILFQTISSEKLGVSAIMALMLSGFTLLLMLLFSLIAYGPERLAAFRRKRHEH